MLCLLVSPGPLRRALLLPGSEPPAPAEGRHVAVDMPEDDKVVQGSDGVYGEETAAGHISPACRVAVRAVFVAYTALAAPALAATALTRFGGGLRALLVLLLVALTIVALFMATVRVSEDEDREREEQEQEEARGSTADHD